MTTASTPYEEVSIIRILRSKGIREADISDEDLLDIIEDSLFRFLFYRPKIAITTAATCLTTVANQPNYDKPTGALTIRNVAWNPDYASDAAGIDDIYTDIMLSNMNDIDPTILMLQYGQMSRLHRMFTGAWEIRNDQIWLMPTPSVAGNKVAVFYTTSRMLEELDRIGDYRFVDLCEASALMAVGQKKLTGGGWRAGAFQVSESVGRETIKLAERKMDKVLLLLANSYGASS